MIRIMLADDHKIIRKGIRTILSMEPDFSVVGEAGTGAETLLLVDRLMPDILILDLVLGESNGIEITRQLVKRGTSTSIIILSMHNSEAYVSEALRAGARAYISKESPLEELVQAIREVAKGRSYHSPLLSRLTI